MSGGDSANSARQRMMEKMAEPILSDSAGAAAETALSALESVERARFATRIRPRFRWHRASFAA